LGAATVPTLTITPPSDYLLARDACSYGYFLLAPNHWRVETGRFETAMLLPGGAVAVRVTQVLKGGGRAKPGAALRVWTSRAMDAQDRARCRARLVRSLRLDEPSSVIAAFHVLDPRWKPTGRGRLMRSGTLFEDMVRTVTSCNVAWPNTVNMNRQLCRHYGLSARDARQAGAWPEGFDHPFPAASRVARLRPGNLRGRCRVGYRDVRLVELARLVVRGAVNEAWLADPATSEDEVRLALLELPGIGPYAAANIMQLLGRYGQIPLDSESVRHGRTVLGMTGSSAQIMKRVDKHFAPFGAHKFRSYWFELWQFYEAKRGPSWTWDRERTGASFTAAKL